MNFDQFKKDCESGTLLVGVSPAEARKFFIETSRFKVQNLLSENLFGQYAVVKVLYWTHWLSLFGSFLFLGFALQWWSLLAIPVAFIIHMIRAGKASMGKQTPWTSFIFLIVCVIVAFLFLSGYIWWQFFICTFPLALFILKVMYISAISYMRDLIINNPKMYEMVIETGLLIVKDTVTGITYRGQDLQPDIDTLTTFVEESQEIIEQEKNKALSDISKLVVNLYVDDLNKYWPEAKRELMGELGEYINTHESILLEEILIASAVMDLVYMRKLYFDDSAILHKEVLNSLSVHTRGEVISAVDNFYGPRLEIAMETFNADEIYIGGIWKRAGWSDDLLLNPISEPMITIVSRLLGKIADKWMMVKVEQLSHENEMA